MKFDISKMLQADVYDHPVGHIELIETHISWVVLTGEFAYKLKKPVNFGFLDFSTFEKRQIACMQELKLNRRLAPELYIDVVSISDNRGKLAISGRGRVVASAVKMAQFPQSAQLDNMLLAGQLNTQHLEAIAHLIADFHQAVEIADQAVAYGSQQSVCKPVEENFAQINEHLDARQYRAALDAIQQWSSASFEALASEFTQRKRLGFVRECHGDLHLRNLVWLNGRPLAFDCIEFSPQLRWIDVISDIAFLVMDLHSRTQPQLANRFLNSYLEITGDYAGLSVLPFYLCYRALVRAKVDALRLEQSTLSEAERSRSRSEFESYLELASGYTRQASPKLIITRGLSASGKSTVSGKLVDAIGAIRIRSDVERKRLFQIAASARAAAEPAAAGIDAGIYSAEASRQTYEKLAELAGGVIKAGYSVIVDAAFLRFEQRQPFQALAAGAQIPYLILETTAPDAVLRQRILKRKNDVSDADLAVLEHQFKNRQPLHADELGALLSVNTQQPLELASLIDRINRAQPQQP